MSTLAADWSQGGLHQVVGDGVQDDQVPVGRDRVRLLHRPGVEEVRAVDEACAQVRAGPRGPSAGRTRSHSRDHPSQVLHGSAAREEATRHVGR